MTDQTPPPAKHATITAALAAAQSEMTRAQKDAKNPHLKSSYATLASVMEASLPALHRHGIAVTQPVRRVDGEDRVFTVLHYGEETLSDEGMPLIVNKRDMQGLGSALTYARRYGLMAMAGIAPADDDGQDAVKNPPQQQAINRTVTDEDIVEAIGYLKGADAPNDLADRWSALPAATKRDARVVKTKDFLKESLSARDALAPQANGQPNYADVMPPY